MTDEKLEDLKVMSSISFVIWLACTIIVAGGEIDSVRNGTVSLWILILIGAILTAVSLLIAVISSRILKKRQGEAYFSTAMYIKGFLEMFFPSLTKDSHPAKMRKRNISEKTKLPIYGRICVLAGIQKT